MRTHYKHAQFLQLVITIGLALAIPGFGLAQDPPRPLSLEDIRSLLKKGVEEREIIDQIQRYKVDFSLNQETVGALVDAGASRGIRVTIEENPFQPLYFTFPNNGDPVGRIIRVEGWSKIFPNKHLWLFVHRKAEVN
jgi:hypothetical protein